MKDRLQRDLAVSAIIKELNQLIAYSKCVTCDYTLL